MNRLIAIITGLHVLAHSLFGCCSHEGAHAASAPHCCHSTIENDCAHQHGLDHRLEQQAADSGFYPLLKSNSAGNPHHVCLHSSCQWLETKPLCPTDVLHLGINGTMAVVPFGNSLVDTAADAAAFSVLSDVISTAPPLRLHLALGVLQI